MMEDSPIQHVDLRLLTATYRWNGDEATPILYGKTEDGETIEIIQRGFRPYFHIADPAPALLTTLSRDPEILDVKYVKLKTVHSRERCARVTLRKPWLTPNYRDEVKRWRGGGRNDVHAADIPYAHRFIYDMDIGSSIRIQYQCSPATGSASSVNITGRAPSQKKLRKLRKLEGVMSFVDTPSFIPPLSILSFDIEASMKMGEIFVIGVVFQDGDGNRQNIHFTGDEKKLLSEFAAWVTKKDPDLITGYNTSGYDWPKLAERAKLHGLELDIGRDGSSLRALGGTKHAAGQRQLWRASGRVLVDTWWEVRKRAREFGSKFHPVSETLDYVAKELLGVGKKDIDRSLIDEEWRRRPEAVIEYCIKDAELALDVLLKLDCIRRYWDIAEVARLPLDEVINGKASLLVDSLLIRKADRMGIAVPMNRRGEKKKIIGAYVHPMRPGLHRNVIALDYGAMYPSIIIENNLCFTTLDPDGDIETPSGHHFLSRKKGVLPSLLKELRARREEYKKKAKATKKKRRRDYYEGLIGALKVLQNSMFGTTAAPFYRFYRPEVASSITAFGREKIKTVIGAMEEEGYTILGADTDGIMFLSPHSALEDSLELARKLAKRHSKGELRLGVDKVFASFFTHGKKKRYVGRMVYPYEDFHIRGFEVRRTDSFPLLANSQRRLFELLLDKGPDEAVRYARALMDSLLMGNATPKTLVISRSVRAFQEYVYPKRLPNVQAAKKAMEAGYDFIPGMKVGYVVTDDSTSPQIVEPFLPGHPFKHAPDYKYYARRLAQSFGRILGMFGWDARSLMWGSSQTVLDDFQVEA